MFLFSLPDPTKNRYHVDILLTADNLTAICEPIIYTKCESLNISQPYVPPWPVTGITLPFTFISYISVEYSTHMDQLCIYISTFIYRSP
jgi:hypothetical protein